MKTKNKEYENACIQRSGFARAGVCLDTLSNHSLQKHLWEFGSDIDVANLPDGFYYVHVYDGINPVPERNIVIIRH